MSTILSYYYLITSSSLHIIVHDTIPFVYKQTILACYLLSLPSQSLTANNKPDIEPMQSFINLLASLLICRSCADAILDSRRKIVHPKQSALHVYHSTDASLFSLSQRGGALQTTTNNEQYKISLSPLVFMSIFAFLGGWSHALCNKKFDSYTAMVSGHIINMSIFIAEKQWKEAFWRMSVVGSYFGGVASARFLEMNCAKSIEEKSKTPNDKDASPNNHHFKVIAGLVIFIFASSEKLEKIQINLLTFGYGMIYPAVSAKLGGTVVHLLTGHTTNVARLVGANQLHHKGMKISICILGSVISGAIFGTNAMAVLGDEFPHFTMLGLLFAAAMLLL